MYYKWRDQLLTDGAKLFEWGGVDHARERLERENRKLKETIGELTIELKKDRKRPRDDASAIFIDWLPNPTFYRNTSVMSLQLFPFPPTSDQTHSRKRKVAEITTEDNIQNEICIF
ncbi:MAG: hypothetical protein L6W00_16545 [Lentisphaeria bacterium]|nr:MAG: hypothetical protein L6W00_16545 [Lentisphaeria bacterium]